MRKPIAELRALALDHNAPILCAGDVFDRWSCSPALINFVLDTLPEVYAVPGQHDLPYHDISRMGDSAFGTLIRAGRVRLLEADQPTCVSKFGSDQEVLVWGFPWKQKLEKPDHQREPDLHIAVVHSYIWQKGYGFPGAPETAQVGAYKTFLKGFDIALFGDNHKGFDATAGNCTVFNCGGFMRRAADEIERKPAVALIYNDGTVERHFLNTAGEQILPKEDPRVVQAENFRLAEFVQELQALGASALDFKRAMREYFQTYEVTAGAQKIIMEALNDNAD